MSTFEFASFTESNLVLQVPNPAVAIEYAPPVSDAPTDRQARIEAVLATAVFAIDAGLRTQDPGNRELSRAWEQLASMETAQGIPGLVEGRGWQMPHYETQRPQDLLQTGRRLGRVLVDAPDTERRLLVTEVTSDRNRFGHAVASARYINPKGATYSRHWLEKTLGVTDVAEHTVAIGLYNGNQQYLDPAMLAKELSEPGLAQAMGLENIDDLGMRVSPTRPEAISSLSYNIGYSGEPTAVPNAVRLQGITDYLEANGAGGWQADPYILGGPSEFQTNAWLYVHHDDSPLELRFEVDASPYNHAHLTHFVEGENPGELVAVDQDGNPAKLQNLAVNTHSVFYPKLNTGRGKVLEPTRDIIIQPEMAGHVVELNTVLGAIRERLIS